MNDNGPSVGAPDFGPPWYVSAIPDGPPAAPTGLAATAGDQSVTLSWNNPGDDSITKYEYNVNHNATGTGNFTGWSPWTDIPNSGKDTTSHQFTGLTNGREYRYHLRAVNNTGPSVGAPADGPPWFASATPTSPDPDPPTNLRVERVCDHKLKVRWHRSAGATGYDLEIGSANGKHWKRLLTNWPGNSWYATNWQKDRTYRFAVRAVNEGGTSEWVNSALSVAPPCAVGNLRVTTSTPGEGDIGASGGSITATWNAGKRANAYHLELNGTRILNAAAVTTHNWDVGIRGTNDTVSVQSVNGGMGSEWRSANVAWLTASSVKGTTATLNLAGHSGDWYVKKTAPTPAGNCSLAGSGATHDLSSLAPGTAHSYTAYSDSSCANAMASTSFTTTASLTVSNIAATSATLNIAGHSGNWWYDADTGPDSTCQGPVSGSSDNLTGLTVHQQYTYTAYSATGCNSGDTLTSITFEPSGDVLKVENLTATTATLKLENHTGSWWFKETSPSTGTCTAGESDFTNDLTGLIPGTEYTYKSYDVDTCETTHEGASVDFTTGGVSVSNLGQSILTTSNCSLGKFVGVVQHCGIGFTTGSAANGYTLHSVTAKFADKIGSPAGFKVELRAASGNNPANTAIQNAMFSGDAPDSAGDHTYTCSGTGCSLSKDTTYFIVITTTTISDSSAYLWRSTSSTYESKVDSNNGWSIANESQVGNTVTNITGTFTSALMMKVAATVNSP